MRKKSSRTPRMVAKPLTPAQHRSIVMAPRLHLDMLLAGAFDIAYVCSIAGLLNIAGIVAHFRARPDIQAEIDKGQLVVLSLIQGSRTPDATESETLAAAFNLADRWIELQDTVTLARAVNYSNKESAEMRHSPSPDRPKD